MRIACRRCDSLYDVPDEKLARGAVKVRCTACQHVFVVKKRGAAAVAAPAVKNPGEARFEDFNFDLFDSPSPSAEPPPEPASPPRPPKALSEPAPDASDLGDLSGLDDLDLPSLGELDLGEFDSGSDFDLREPPAEPPRPGPDGLEQVRQEDLVAPVRTREVPIQGLSEDMPRLDLQKGPRRGEAGSAAAPSPLVPRDRGRSPLFWVVVAAAVVTAGYSAYNAYRHPEAFTFLSPSRLTALLTHRSAEAQFAVEGLEGYYRALPGGRRIFLVRGKVANLSGKPQGLVRARAVLFGKGGGEVASAAAYCGNVLSERELAALSPKAIQARLENQVGEALSNVDIAPAAKVPFMIVFSSPPDGVQKFDVTVSAGKAGKPAP